MPKVENDETKHVAQPFLLIAQKRSGGTFLAHCLSTHPDVFCDRGESLHRKSVWRRFASTMSVADVARALWHQEGYLASGFRTVYSQAENPAIWQQVLRQKPRLIHLTRRNLLRQAVSLTIQRKIRLGELVYYPLHTFRPAGGRPAPRYTVNPGLILAECDQLMRSDAAMAAGIAATGLAVLELTYGAVTGGEGGTQTRIPEQTENRLCSFLGVCSEALTARLARVHACPLRAMFENWREIEVAVEASEFARYLADEAGWVESPGGWTKERTVERWHCPNQG